MNQFSPLVSVIIPTYNRSGSVLNAINSVISQTYKNIEIIVVDDNSKDDTENVLNNIDFPISYIKQKENKGGSAARNIGIDTAKGDYIAFLDDDDEWLPGKIETQIKCLGDYEVSLTGYYLQGNNKVKIVFNMDEVRLQDILKVNTFSTSGLLVKSTLMKELKFDVSLPNGQDFDVLVGILKDRNIKYIREALYIIDDGQHDRITNKILTITEEQMENNLRVINKHRSVLGDYWYRYQVAYRYMSYSTKREKKLERLSRGLSRAGIFPILHVLLDKLIRKLRNTCGNILTKA